MKPLIYGYISVQLYSTDDDVLLVTREIQRFADCRGFRLGEVFIERIGLSGTAFYSLIDALRASDVNDVVIPGMYHLALPRTLQDAMKTHLEQATGAKLWVVSDERKLDEDL